MYVLYFTPSSRSNDAVVLLPCTDPSDSGERNGELRRAEDEMSEMWRKHAGIERLLIERPPSYLVNPASVRGLLLETACNREHRGA